MVSSIYLLLFVSTLAQASPAPDADPAQLLKVVDIEKQASEFNGRWWWTVQWRNTTTTKTTATTTTPTTSTTPTEGILTVGGVTGYGGVDGGSVSTVEIFNPRSGRSCKISDIPVATDGLSLCGNLACGGRNSPKSCFLFDGAGTFTALSVTLREQRVEHLCWQLQNGSVLLLGGKYSGTTTEILPADGSSSTADFNLPYNIRGACGIELNGNFILTGGYNNFKTLNTVALFTETGRVIYLPDLQIGRHRHACSKFVDNNGETALMVIGGYSNIYESSAEIYLNSKWSFAASIGNSLSDRLRASTLQNSIYVSGGYYGPHYWDRILRYNPSNDTWTEAGQLTEPKHSHASTTLADISQFNDVCLTPVVEGTWGAWSDWGPCSVTCGWGVQTRSRTCDGGDDCPGEKKVPRNCNTDSCETGILTIGGIGVSNAVTTAEIFNPKSGRSCKIGDLPGRTHSASFCGNLACGGNTPESIRSCSRFDGRTFQTTSVTLKQDRRYHLCWPLRSGQVLLLGGIDSQSTTERLTADGTSSTPDFNLPYRFYAVCSIKLNGNFIITGGAYSKRTVAEFTETGQVTYLPDLQEERYFHACSKFVGNNGETVLLVAGGLGASDRLSSTEIYLNSQWSFAASLPSPRYALAGSTVQNTVYVSGGTYDGFGPNRANLDTILQYNPSTDNWTEAGQMTEPKFYHTSTTVADISQFNEICFFEFSAVSLN